LTRTTRSVAPTEAGERLVRTVGPLSELREKPAGTIRITTSEYAAEAILWPALAKLLPGYPDIKVEIIVDSRTGRGRGRRKISPVIIVSICACRQSAASTRGNSRKANVR
jgi:hypothetical protein